MDTKQIIYGMLTENTGTHFLDSGGSEGRMWQRNAKKTMQDFENESEQSYEFDFKYIFLVRDGRGVFNSYQKKHFYLMLPNDEGEIKEKCLPIPEKPDPIDVIRGWRKYNLKLLLFQKLNVE